MTIDPFTRASPHWIAAQRNAGRNGQAFEWTSGGHLINWGALFGWLHGIITRGRRIL